MDMDATRTDFSTALLAELYPHQADPEALRSRSFISAELGRIDIHRSQIMVAARYTKPVKWTVRRS